MNEYEVEEARDRYRGHPLLGPATETLYNLMQCVNRNSDGWPYWQQPQRACAKLVQLIEGEDRREARFDRERLDVTPAKLKAAYVPIKSFLTRTGLTSEIVQP